MILSLSKNRRSIRKYSNKKVDKNEVLKICECGLNYPSRSNKQPLRFFPVTNDNVSSLIFDTIKWGSKVESYKVFANKDFRPSSFIVVGVDTSILSAGYEYEMGASIGMILLGATEKEISSLWVKSFDIRKVKEILNIKDENIKIDSLVCLGYKNQISSIKKRDDNISVIIKENLDIEVPKRSKEEVMFENGFIK